jgi:dTDP-4-dehydrorhamnose reductase
MKRVLIVGGTGFVGGNMAMLARERSEMFVFGHTDLHELDKMHCSRVDITKREELLPMIAEVAPEVVVNAAAISNIDFAEKNQGLAWKVNVLGAEHVAEGCKADNARHIFFSSDAVFDGTAGSYSEQDTPSPVNYYGKTKAAAERRVLSIYPNSVVIRISLVLGYPVTGGNALYPSLEDHLHRGEEIAVPVQEVRTPVDVLTLCESALELAENDYAGIIHIGSTESISRYDLSRKVARAMGYRPDLIKPEEAGRRTNRAPRHRNGVISVQVAQRLLRTKMLGVDGSIRRSIDERLLEKEA